MTTLRAFGLAVAVAAMSVPATAFAASNLTGNYLLTADHVKPSSYNGQTLCVTLNEDGSVLGWANSGTITIDGVTGQFFIDQRQILAWIYSSNGVATLTAGVPGGNTISNAAFSVTDSSGNSYVAGAFTSQKNGC